MSLEVSAEAAVDDDDVVLDEMVVEVEVEGTRDEAVVVVDWSSFRFLALGGSQWDEAAAVAAAKAA